MKRLSTLNFLAMKFTTRFLNFTSKDHAVQETWLAESFRLIVFSYKILAALDSLDRTLQNFCQSSLLHSMIFTSNILKSCGKLYYQKVFNRML